MKRLVRSILLATGLLAACASESPVDAANAAPTTDSPTASVVEQVSSTVPDESMEEGRPASSQPVGGSDEAGPEADEPAGESYPEDVPDVAAAPSEPNADPNILEPANAQLGDIAGWVPVDNWYNEPIGVSSSAECAPLNVVLGLEEWGVITSFWLQDGTELYHHTAELNTEENVSEYLRAVADLARCGRTDFGGAALTTNDFTVDPFTGATLDVAASAAATWLFEGGRTTSFVVMSRQNVVSILQVVPTPGFDMAEFEVLAHEALETLDTLADG